MLPASVKIYHASTMGLNHAEYTIGNAGIYATATPTSTSSTAVTNTTSIQESLPHIPARASTDDHRPARPATTVPVT